MSQVRAKLIKRKIKNVKARRDVKRNRAKKARRKVKPLHFYKYLDLDGARLTLQNRKFRHAKPSSFNDTEDLTTAAVFNNPEQDLSNFQNIFIDVLVKNLDVSPTCSSPMREEIKKLQKIILSNPRVIDILKNNSAQNPSYGDTEDFIGLMSEHLRDINDFFQTYRVLCVTTSSVSEHMWKKYSKNHKGIVLRIRPNLQKNSKFSLFKPVEYIDRRPPLYSSVEEFIHGSVFGDLQARCKNICEKIIFSKTREWEGENEYRLAIPIIDEEPWETLPYHPEELAELYLGLELDDIEMQEIASLARHVNPHIQIYAMNRLDNGKLSYKRYRM